MDNRGYWSDCVVAQSDLSLCVVCRQILSWWGTMSRCMTKATKWLVRPVKTQISLCIHAVWSESLLCARVAEDPRFLHADSEDWSDWTDVQADLSFRWTPISFCLFCHTAAPIVLLHILDYLLEIFWTCSLDIYFLWKHFKEAGLEFIMQYVHRKALMIICLINLI